MAYDSTLDNLDHVRKVGRNLGVFIAELNERGIVHDASKFEEPEKSAYDRCIPEMQKWDYGTPEHKAATDALGPALEHHLTFNSHHPEFYGPEGIAGMDLFDLVEMLCDWKAAAQRPPQDGTVRLDITVPKFGIDPQLASILQNTLDRWPA